MSEVVLTDSREEFENIVSSNDRVVVDFTAPARCVPCQRFAPHFDKAAENSDGIVFVAVDVDKAPWAMTDYGVQSVPTVALFENGERTRDIKSRTVVPLLQEIS